MLLFVLVPVRIAVADATFEKLLSYPILTTITVLLVLDFLVQGNSGFFSQGLCETSRQRVLTHYAKNVFPYNLLIFLLTILEPTINSWILVLLYVKISYVQQLLKRLEEVFELTVRAQNFLELINLFFSLLFVAHLFACIWLYIPRFEDENNSWIYKFELLDESIAY
jgi:hypothetical protein